MPIRIDILRHDEEDDVVEFRIVEQDMIGFRRFIASNGVSIDSCSCPEWSESSNTFYTRGDDNRQDRDIIEVDIETFDRIEEALFEFNRDKIDIQGRKRQIKVKCKGTCGPVLCDECKKNYNLAVQFEFARST